MGRASAGLVKEHGEGNGAQMAQDRHSRGPAGSRGEVKGRIAQAARDEFVAHGHDGTTMRAIARAAHCDQAMVSYYFGSKQRLFRMCFDLPADPAEEVLALLAPGIEGAGERLLRFGLALYEEHVTSDTMQALMRALVTDAATSRRFRQYIRTDVIAKIDRFIGGGSGVAEQIELLMATMYGVAMMRYFVRLEPIASMPVEQLVQELAPSLQQRIDQAVRLS